MEVVYERCAGLDVHKKSITACVLWALPKGKKKQGSNKSAGHPCSSGQASGKIASYCHSMIAPFSRRISMTKSLLAGSALMLAMSAAPALAAPQCDADNGGITLPKGFCAMFT